MAREMLSIGEYHDLLLDNLQTVNTPKFQPLWFDNKTPGFHDFGTNCGLCVRTSTTKDKYENTGQKCPFDLGPYERFGCWYRCAVVNGEDRFGEQKPFLQFTPRKNDPPAIAIVREKNWHTYKLRILAQTSIQEFENEYWV
jgi:hypothetical protein